MWILILILVASCGPKPHVAVKADVIVSGKQYRACTDKGCTYCNNNRDEETVALLKCVEYAKDDY